MLLWVGLHGYRGHVKLDLKIILLPITGLVVLFVMVDHGIFIFEVLVHLFF